MAHGFVAHKKALDWMSKSHVPSHVLVSMSHWTPPICQDPDKIKFSGRW